MERRKGIKSPIPEHIAQLFTEKGYVLNLINGNIVVWADGSKVHEFELKNKTTEEIQAELIYFIEKVKPVSKGKVGRCGKEALLNTADAVITTVFPWL